MTKKTTKLIPLGNRLLLRRDKNTTVEVNGIALPQVTQDKERPRTATVLAVGRGLVADDGTIVPINLKPGDRVIVSKHCGVEIRDPDDWYSTLIICQEDEIQCLLTEK